MADNKTKISTLAALIVLLAWGAAETAEASLYCGRDLVRVGDPIYVVARRCPEPFWVERRQVPIGYDRHGYPLGFAPDTVEIWYLNFGQRRFMRQLTFRNGRLERETTLGYGVAFEPGTRRCSARELQTAGDSAAEVFARCGEPDFRYDMSTRSDPYYGGPWPIPDGVQREIWAYQPGSGQLTRELYFVDGRLIHVRVEGR